MSIGKLTDKSKTLLAQAARNTLKDVTNDDTYYIFVGYTDSEQYPFADSDRSESTLDSDLVQVYRNVVSMHRVLPGGVSRVIPRKNWVKNNYYRGWYHGIDNTHDYYVLSTEIIRGVPRQNVYKCLFAPHSASTIPPTGVSPTPFKTTDGYWWQYMYTITNSEAILFQNNSFMPVPEKIRKSEEDAITTGTSRFDQLQVQNNARKGSIFNIRIDSEFADTASFTTKTTISLRAKDGYGNNADITQDFKATATRDSEGDSNWRFQVQQFGAGFTALPYAFDSDQDSDNSRIHAFKLVMSEKSGHGTSAADELKAQNVMFVSRGIPESGDYKAIAQNDYAMIGLIKNPIDTNTGEIGTQDFYLVAEKAICDNVALFNLDSEFQKAGDSNTRGRVVAVDNKNVYYVKSGLLEKNFADSDSISQGSVHSNSIQKRIPPEIDFNSGDFLAIDYLATSLTRSPDQIESLNIVLEL